PQPRFSVGGEVSRVDLARWNVEHKAADQWDVGAIGPRLALRGGAMTSGARSHVSHDVAPARYDRRIRRGGHVGVGRVEFEILTRRDEYSPSRNEEHEKAADEQQYFPHHGSGLRRVVRKAL